MPLGDLLPWITGGGGAIAALVIGWTLILTGKLVTGREHDRLLADYGKVTEANDALTASLQACRDNNMQLLNSGQLTTKLLDTLAAVAHERGSHPVEGGEH